jgi:hypothetical protein
MLTWETNKPPELKGKYKYDEKQSAVRILLDGQQRATTLSGTLRVEMPFASLLVWLSGRLWASNISLKMITSFHFLVSKNLATVRTIVSNTRLRKNSPTARY